MDSGAVAAKRAMDDKEEYDYEVTRQTDYKYELGGSPFGTTVARVSRLARALGAAREVPPMRLSRSLGCVTGALWPNCRSEAVVCTQSQR